MDKEIDIQNSKIFFLSNFPPYECGIATFTKDLVTAMDKRFNPKLKSMVIALNDETGIQNYSKKVTMEINRENIEDFINKAEEINKSKDIKLVCIQHEFGIFGGEFGNYLIPFLDKLEKPSVVTFHSVLPNPDEKRKRIVSYICDKCSAVVVMAKRAIEILNKDYGVKKNKIYLIYHGIPNVSLKKSNYYKKKLKLQNKTVLLTFGLLSRGKGIEHVIHALPNLVKKYPNLLYIVLGETHPKVRGTEGESYRNELIKEVEKLGLKEHVKFYNKYVRLKEIVEYLLASDIYLCTNINSNQIVSGTLSYALGCGKAVVSTPIEYSKEILKNERGLIVEMNNSSSIEKAINQILSDPELKLRLEKNAYSFSRAMTWPVVATRYLGIFNKIVKLRKDVTEKYPKIKLNHLRNLTDNFGCLQFSKDSMPDKSSGYTLDDNARALIVTTLYNKIFESNMSQDLSEIYLKFLEQSQDFKNNFKNENEILRPYSEDAFGRTIWALGYYMSEEKDKEKVERAKVIFDKAYKIIDTINSPRAKAFIIFGLYYHYKKTQETEKLEKIKELADYFADMYKNNYSEDWKWFEDKLTYSNSILSEALFLAGELTDNKQYLEIAETTLEFLSNIVLINNCLYPIGESGWCKRNGERAFFDQQPIDAAAMVQVYIAAYRITGKKDYYDKSVLAFNWFLGKNHLKQMIYDETTGGCYDGLAEREMNMNQGAESTIVYLTSRLMLEELKKISQS